MLRSPIWTFSICIGLQVERKRTLASISAITARIFGTRAVTAAVSVVESAVSSFYRVSGLKLKEVGGGFIYNRYRCLNGYS